MRAIIEDFVLLLTPNRLNILSEVVKFEKIWAELWYIYSGI